MRYDAIVLAGGAAMRLGGVDKPMLDVAGAPMLVHVLDAVSAAGVRVVVGPRRPIARPVLWCQEVPPGGGPVAGLAAAVPLTAADTLVVLAADLPRIAPAIGPLLQGLSPPVLQGPGDRLPDVAMLTRGGRRNYLAAAWRRPALIAALARLGDPRDAPMRALVDAAAHIAEVVDTGPGDAGPGDTGSAVTRRDAPQANSTLRDRGLRDRGLRDRGLDDEGMDGMGADDMGWGDDCDTWADLARHRAGRSR